MEILHRVCSFVRDCVCEHGSWLACIAFVLVQFIADHWRMSCFFEICVWVGYMGSMCCRICDSLCRRRVLIIESGEATCGDGQIVFDEILCGDNFN